MISRYHRLAVRERVLLLAFLGLAALLWGWGGLARAARLHDRIKAHRTEVAAQDLWLEKRAQVEALSRQAAERLQPALMLDATRLFTEVNRLAQGLDCEISGQRTEQSGGIAIHHVRVRLRKTDMAALLRFHAELEQRAPYLGIEQCELAADSTATGWINASFAVYAIQVAAGEAVKI